MNLIKTAVTIMAIALSLLSTNLIAEENKIENIKPNIIGNT